MCWTFCWTKCWTLFLSKIRILFEISISSGDRLGKLLGDGAGEGNRTLVFSLEVSGISQCFQRPFRHFAAFWAIEITTELLFVGMAVASPCASFSSHLTAATSLLHTTDQESIWDRSRINRADSITE